MIFRLQYCNDSGDTAMIDIETKIGVGVQEIEGSGNPFSLQYKTEKSDKSGRFMTSSANIEIYENEFFNIDILKTSNETDIKVSYYINEVLEWQGFILPDFFSKEIKDNAVISMTASDRINTLKAVTLSDLPEKIELRELAELCLAKTGLTLPLYTMADFTHADENNDTLFRTKIQSQRLDDEKGRSISCYDILESILIISNAQIVQRKGIWQIVNKYQLEQGVGKNYNSPRGFNNWSKTLHNFTFIGKGAIRTITPVASSVGIFQEYGGGKRYPDNYDFNEVGGWTARNGFSFTRDNREIIEYNKIGEYIVPTYGAATENYYLVNNNAINLINPTDIIGEPYLESTKVNVPFSSSRVEINIDINAIAPKATFIGLPLVIGASVNYAVVAESTTETLILNKSGQFVPLANGRDNFQRLIFDLGNDYEVLTKGDSIKGLLEVEGDVSDYKISVRIYGSGEILTTFVNFLSYTFKSEKEIAKGTLYKTTQGTNFTKEHDVETTVFGDYLTKGVNGYFYDYQNDDTSSLIKSNNDKTNLWTAPNEAESLPLLQQISRQKARQFSIAHDIIRGDIEIKNFDPLTIFKDCNNKEYVVVSAQFDFLRSVASVEIEQILYDSNISRRDYIYSYFGEGESSIKSVGGISGGSGSGGSGGGMTSSQLEMLTNLADWWKLDEENDAIFSEKSVYSLKGVSALGLGSDGGGGGGGGVDMLDSWANYTEAKANYYVPASLLVPFRNDTLSRLASLESGSATSITTTGTGNAITSLTKSGSVITANKGLTFALASHTHTKAQVGLGNVDNTSDLLKPISTATQNALNGKLNKANGRVDGRIGFNLDGLEKWYIDVNNNSGFAFSEYGVASRFLIAPGGNVGIGTTNPLYKLDVSGTGRFTGSVTAPTFVGALDGNAKTVTNGVYTNNTQTITGAKTFNTGIKVSQTAYEDFIVFDRGVSLWSFGMPGNNLVISNGDIRDQSNRLITIGSNGNIRIGDYIVNPLYKLDVAGTGRFTGNVTAPTFIGALSGNASSATKLQTPQWVVEQVGTELQFKYNGVIKQRMLSNGTILAVGGVTALAPN